MSEFVILIPPEHNAVSLDEIRAYLRIGSDADNATLSIIQSAAIANIEDKNKRALIKRKVRQSFTNRDISKALALSHKMGGAPYLRPTFAPQSIVEARLISENGFSIIENDAVSIEGLRLKLNQYAYACEIDYFAGFETPDEVPNGLKLAVLEEVSRLIALRDNEKSQIQKPEVRL